jgi:hypothetical protein
VVCFSPKFPSPQASTTTEGFTFGLPRQSGTALGWLAAAEPPVTAAAAIDAMTRRTPMMLERKRTT